MCATLTFWGEWCKNTEKGFCAREPGDGRRFGCTNPKGGVDMPITLTFHVFGCTVTVKVKSDNRHSAK